MIQVYDPSTGAVVTPQQNNGLDCGVFSCMFSNYLSRDLDLRFSHADIPTFRARITLDLLRGEVDL
jgi:sentrin-specific protease 1